MMQSQVQAQVQAGLQAQAQAGLQAQIYAQSQVRPEPEIQNPLRPYPADDTAPNASMLAQTIMGKALYHVDEDDQDENDFDDARVLDQDRGRGGSGPGAGAATAALLRWGSTRDPVSRAVAVHSLRSQLDALESYETEAARRVSQLLVSAEAPLGPALLPFPSGRPPAAYRTATARAAAV